MPKTSKPSSTDRRHARVADILDADIAMPTPCDRCKENGLKCVVELSTGFCAYCIRAKARCSLVLTRTERQELKVEQRRARLRIAQLEAELSAEKLKLLEAEEKERCRILEDIASTAELEQLEVAAG